MRVVFSEGFFTNRQGFLLYVTNLIEETSPPRIACHRQARHSLISPCVFSFLIYAYPRIFVLPQQETNPIGGAQSLISITLASGSKMKICENEDLYDPRGDLHTPKFEEFYVLLFRRFFGLTECILTNFIVISREESRNPRNQQKIVTVILYDHSLFQSVIFTTYSTFSLSKFPYSEY